MVMERRTARARSEAAKRARRRGPAGAVLAWAVLAGAGAASAQTSAPPGTNVQPTLSGDQPVQTNPGGDVSQGPGDRPHGKTNTQPPGQGAYSETPTGVPQTNAPHPTAYTKGRGPGRENEYFDRNEEEYGYLRDPSKRTDFFDPAKFVPLDPQGDIFLSFNGEERLRLDYSGYKYLHNANGDNTMGALKFGTHEDHQLVLYDRNELGALLNIKDSLIFYAEAINGQETGRNLGATLPGVQNNELTFAQEYVEIRNVSDPIHYGARLGRQYIFLGNGLQVAPNYSTNLPIPTYDAERLYVDAGWARVDALYANSVDYTPGVLKTEDDNQNATWSVYSQFDLPRFKLANQDGKSTFDAFYFGYRNVPSTTLNRGAYYDDIFVTGTISSTPFSGIVAPSIDKRQTLGARYSGTIGRFDYDWQGAWQGGSYGNYDVNAFAVNTDTGYTFPLPWRPRLGLRVNGASGGANSHTISTYQPFQSALFYYSENFILSPTNMWNIAPRLTFHPTDKIAVLVYDSAFWRYSRYDAVYSGLWQGGGGPNPFATSAYNHASFIANQPAMRVTWAPIRHLNFEFIAADFRVGPALRDSGSRDTPYFRWLADARF